MPAGTSPQPALARVLRWLARRDRSEAEIRSRLAEWGVDSDESATVIARLRGRGLIDDAALAERICDWHARHDPLGPLGLRLKLRQRGIPDELSEAALQPWFDWECQRELAERVLVKREAALVGLSPATRWRRQGDALRRRGFEPDLIRTLTEPLLRAAGDDDEQ